MPGFQIVINEYQILLFECISDIYQNEMLFGGQCLIIANYKHFSTVVCTSDTAFCKTDVRGWNSCLL